MSAKSILNEQFDACFDQSAWFASAKSALENLSVDDAVWKPTDEIHSVCEIISHLNFYNQKCLRRFKDIKINKESMEIAETYSNEDWKNVLDEFNSIVSEWKVLLENADEAKLAEGDSGSMIAHFNIHNSYHIGQIVTTRKLRGSWSAWQGVS
jgi:DinB superfamily